MVCQANLLLLASAIPAATATNSSCKTTPLDSTWPSAADWRALNASIDGVLLSTVPVASSCWPGNPFGSSLSCETVKANWTSGLFHSQTPESIDYPLFANNSCLPPGVDGYAKTHNCQIGGLPRYIVKATTEQQIATAVKWAADRNIRIVVKGTGHDLSGRSSGAHALSIWTRGFRKIERNESWATSDSRGSEDVFIVGSGQQWGEVLTEALKIGRVVTTGQDPSVGLGGYIQGGGHGPLSSTYGLAAHQVLQMTVVTTKGQILVANQDHNQDIFWALRGGGAGQYGIVTEYVIRHHPAPSNVTVGTLTIAPRGTHEQNGSWNAAATLLRTLPDLMDAGLAGAATMATGAAAMSFSTSLKAPTNGTVMTQVLWAFNTTSAAVSDLVNPVVSQIRNQYGNQTVEVSWSASSFANYSAFYTTISGSNDAGGGSVFSSRLLGRTALVGVPFTKVVSNLRTALRSENVTAGTYATIGLSGGPGVREVSADRWGATLPAWRAAYLHFITYGADSDPIEAGSAKLALNHAADWTNQVKESLWREWAPQSGAYMNEANPYNSGFKEDFYGSSYDSLLQTKRKYDPSESLFVLSGVGSDCWDYDLDSGKLCKTK